MLLFCQPRVEVTSCFVYKVMGLILPQTALKRDCNGNALSESRVIT